MAMNDQHGIIDTAALIGDLRLAVRYATRVGALKNSDMIAKLEKAEAAISSNAPKDAYEMSVLLNEVVALIAPMTIADLRSGRDPFLPENQRKVSRLQIALMGFGLLVMVAIGDYMHSLQNEQDAVAALDKIRDLKPQEKLSELRRLVQWDEPLALPRTPRSLNDQYHQKVAELVVINSTMMNTYTRALAAAEQPMMPLGRFLSAPETPPVLGAPAPAANDAAGNGQAGADPCAEDANGELRLPDEAKDYPKWMKTALRDSLGDMCFQLNVVAPNGGGQIPSEAISQLAFADSIKEKIALRSAWFLPFMFGLLGSVLFAIHNNADVRTPMVSGLQVIMRVALGGIAGIIVGWFTGADAGTVPKFSLISLPFALAFLTGYGIDILFSVLDKAHHAVLKSASRQS